MKFGRIGISKEITNTFTAPIPASLIKERAGGGNKRLKYLSGSTVTDLLNKAFGYMWNWTVKQQWIEESQPFFNQYSNSTDKVINPSNGKLGAWEPQAPVAHVLGTLEVFVVNDQGDMISIKKDGFGSKSILGKQNDQESIFKAAGTDALKKAASLLGVGLELYRDEEEQIYFDEMNYEDPWTDEVIKKHEESLAIYNDYLQKAGLDQFNDQDQIANLVLLATNNRDTEIYPDNIDTIAKYITSLYEQQEEGAE